MYYVCGWGRAIPNLVCSQMCHLAGELLTYHVNIERTTALAWLLLFLSCGPLLLKRTLRWHFFVEKVLALLLMRKV